MSYGGYVNFDDIRVLAGAAIGARPVINGRQFDASLVPFGPIIPTPGVMLEALDESTLIQYRFLGAREPLNTARLALPLQMQVDEQADFLELLLLLGSGRPVTFFPSWPHVDTWLVLFGPTETVRNSSRRTAWNGSTITHATHPPRAFIDGVEQTIITAGTPVAGEVKIPESQTAGEGNFEVTTPDLSGGAELLQVLYYPEYIVRFEGLQPSIGTPNQMLFSGDIVECRPAPRGGNA